MYIEWTSWRECQSDGQWGSVPTCESEYIDRWSNQEVKKIVYIYIVCRGCTYVHIGVYTEEGWNLSIEDIHIRITGTQLAVLYMSVCCIYLPMCVDTLHAGVRAYVPYTALEPHAVNIITDLCGVSSPLFSAGVCISLKIVCTYIRT